MNCLKGDYKRMNEASSDCDEEAETSIDACKKAPATDKQAEDASGEQQRVENRTEGAARILPILRSGEKQSDTHYFFIPPPVFRVPVSDSPQGSRHTESSIQSSPDEPQAASTESQDMSELVTSVTNLVHGITDEEARMALTLSHMNVERACQYLSVEQLFRLGFTRDQATRALSAAGGSLEKASAALITSRYSASSAAHSAAASDR